MFSVGEGVRDSQAMIMGATAETIRNPKSVKRVELKAIRSGIDFCVRQGFKFVFFQTLSKLYMRKLRMERISDQLEL